MKVPDEIIAMFDRAREFYDELMEEYKKCIENNEVSTRARIITHDVFEKCRHALDHSMRVYWNKNYSQLYSSNRVYFPITRKIKNFKKVLKDQEMANLKIGDPKMYDFLLNCQVFTNKKYQWLYNLTRIAGKGKHEEFSKQTRKDFNIHTIEKYGGRVSWAEEVMKFNTNESKGAKDSNFGRYKMELIERSNDNPEITHLIKKSISFRIGNDDRDIITILNELIRKTYNLIQKFFELA